MRVPVYRAYLFIARERESKYESNNISNIYILYFYEKMHMTFQVISSLWGII